MFTNVCIIIFPLVFTVASCTKESTTTPRPPVEVTDYQLVETTVPIVFEYLGFAESSHPVEIRARVEGYLDRIAYTEGQIVKEGDLLFQLDPKQFEAKVEEARGELAKQQAAYENATLTVNRLTPLYQQKAASKKDLDNAQSSQLSSAASIQTAKAQLLDNEINLGYTTITSPITGFADRSKFREGALITTNSLLTTVSVLDPIWVYFTVSENEILRTQQQLSKEAISIPNLNEYEVEILLSDGSTFPYIGKVDFNSPTYDQSTGTLLARATFKNPIDKNFGQPRLLPGQFVRVKIWGAERPNALLVPRRALMQKNSGMFVYLIDKNNKVIAQDVSVGDWYKEYQIVTNGLQPGDQIVVDGINKIAPGSAVKVVERWKDKEQAANSTPLSPKT